MTRRQARIRLDGARIDAALLGDAAGDGVELHRLQERDQVLVVRLVHGEVVYGYVERHVLVERHQLLRQPRLLGERGQVLAALGLLDLGCVREQVLKIAVLAKQFRRRLRADARHARHVVGGIADQRLRLDHLLWADAEFFDDLLGTDAAVLHGVVHDDAVADELHQILVGRDNCRRRAGLAGEPRVGGDQVVGFEANLLQVRQLEGTHGVADERELRAQVLGRFRPVRLVFGIHFISEGLFRLVEHHGEMGRLVLRLHLGQELPQHVAEAEHGVDLQPVRFARQRRQCVIGAEDVAGAVDQEEVVALLQRPRARARRRGGGFRRGFGGGLGIDFRGGWHGGQFGPHGQVNQSGNRTGHRECGGPRGTRLGWNALLWRAASGLKSVMNL